VVEAYLRQSPLAHLGLGGRAQAQRGEAGIAMDEQPFRGLVGVRAKAADPAALQAIEGVLGFALPREANTTASSGSALALWLGPDEWWIVTPGPDPQSGPQMTAALRDALAGHRGGATTDLSDSRTCLRIGGRQARALLSKGTPLDLHPRAFAAGRCAQSHLAKVDVLVHLVADDSGPDGPTFELYVLRSFAEYLWTWLEDASREYGLTVVAA